MLKRDDNVVKNFDILAISLGVLNNYFLMVQRNYF